ncbi:MAG: hypothetical protein QM650_15425 [Microlunatus sp.]
MSLSEILSRLLLLTADQIDYGSLPIEVLGELSLAGDPYIASCALTELQKRDSAKLISVAEDLVSDVTQDDDLRASAFAILLEYRNMDHVQLRMLLKSAGPQLSERIEAELD